MKFGDDLKVLWWTLEKEETKAFIDFLDDERERHYEAIETAEWCITAIEHSRRKYDKASREFWETAIKRHEKDIEDIDNLVKQVKHWFQLEDK